MTAGLPGRDLDGAAIAAFAFECGRRSASSHAAVLGLVGFVGHHALGEERGKRLPRVRRKRQMPRVAHRPHEKPRVEQVQNRVLDAADILIDRQPVMRRVEVDGRLGLRRREANEIPRRVDERVHRVGFANGRFAANRAVDVLPRRMPVERIAGLVERRVLGKFDRQSLFRAPARRHASCSE